MVTLVFIILRITLKNTVLAFKNLGVNPKTGFNILKTNYKIKDICTYSSYLHIGLLQNPDCFVDLTHTFGWDLEELSLISTYFLWDDRKTLCKSFPESKSYRDKVLSSLKTNRHGLKLLSFKSGRPRVSWMGPIQNSCNVRIEI